MLEKEQVSEVNARVFGENMRESFASYDLDTSSWRTSALSLFGGSMLYSETWPRSGMMRNGISYRLQPLVPRTSEKGSGLWPTPNCLGYRSDGELKILARTAKDRAEYLAMSTKAANSKRERHWPTPRTRGLIGGSGSKEMMGDMVKRGELDLEEAEAMAGVKMWPTPTSRDWKGPGANGRHRDGKLQLDTLDRAVQGAELPTGQLNPTWVEWLMGYPGGWTDLEDSATP
jgi:hypothetical protein